MRAAISLRSTTGIVSRTLLGRKSGLAGPALRSPLPANFSLRRTQDAKRKEKSDPNLTTGGRKAQETGRASYIVGDCFAIGQKNDRPRMDLGRSLAAISSQADRQYNLCVWSGRLRCERAVGG